MILDEANKTAMKNGDEPGNRYAIKKEKIATKKKKNMKDDTKEVEYCDETHLKL